MSSRTKMILFDVDNSRCFRKLNEKEDIKRVAVLMDKVGIHGFRGDLRNLPIYSSAVDSNPHLYAMMYRTDVIEFPGRDDVCPFVLDDGPYSPCVSMYRFPFVKSETYCVNPQNIDVCGLAVDKRAFCSYTIIVPNQMQYAKMMFILYNNDFSPKHYYKYKLAYAYFGSHYFNYGTSDLYKVLSNKTVKAVLFLNKDLGWEREIENENVLSKYGFTHLDIYDSKALDVISNLNDLEEYLKYGTKLV